MKLLVLSQADIRATLSIEDCIKVLRSAMVVANSSESRLPLRQIMTFDGGRALGLMPGYIPSPECFGSKITALFPDNYGSGFSSHSGAIVLFEARHGNPIALLHGAQVTAIRTAAASALATDVLSRPDCTTLSILGYGEQAAWHLRSMAVVRRLDRVVVWGRSAERAGEFSRWAQSTSTRHIDVAPTPKNAVKDADIICTTTAATDPIVFGEWLTPGVHVNLVGSSVATAREVDDDVVARSRFFVDYRPSAEAQAAEYLSALASGRIKSGHIAGTIGDVLAGTVVGRTHPSDITVYKSLGISAQDLAASWFAVEKARQLNVGTQVDFSLPPSSQH